MTNKIKTGKYKTKRGSCDYCGNSDEAVKSISGKRGQWHAIFLCKNCIGKLNNN